MVSGVPGGGQQEGQEAHRDPTRLMTPKGVGGYRAQPLADRSEGPTIENCNFYI